MVTHTRLAFGRSRAQILWPANLVEVFGGFLNLKIAKELVIFKDKCRVGPLIPLQMLCFTRPKAIVNKIVNYISSSPTDGSEI